MTMDADTAQKPKGSRPNILFILSDDQGPWALGAAGNSEIATPNLDGLGIRGAILDNFFCVSPVCSPARASLLTGMIPSRHGVHDWLEGHESGPDRIDYLEGQRLVTDEFAAHDYRVGVVGKWHLGASDIPRPGISHWYVLKNKPASYRDATMYRGEDEETVTDYLTDVIADDAIGFLEEQGRAEEPFFLSVNFTAPHRPWAKQHPKRFEELYEDCPFDSLPEYDQPHPWLATRNGLPIAAEADLNATRIGYYAAVTAMDEAIGRILARLEDLGLRDDTIVVFTSDNGFNLGHHGVWGKGNGTLPMNMYDSSVKVPAIFSGPSIRPGQRLDGLFSAYDMAATLLELAGLDGGAFEIGPGRSFASALTGGDPGQGHPVVVFDEYGPVRMLRTPDWKYVHRYPDGPHELYHLAEDPGEENNLAGESAQADHIRDLREQLTDWFQNYRDPAMDGANLPVTGGGQIDVVAKGAGAFRDRDHI